MLTLDEQDWLHDQFSRKGRSDLRQAIEASSGGPFMRTVMAEARRGDVLDAITTLDRNAHPKWGSKSASEAAYLQAMEAV